MSPLVFHTHHTTPCFSYTPYHALFFIHTISRLVFHTQYTPDRLSWDVLQKGRDSRHNMSEAGMAAFKVGDVGDGCGMCVGCVWDVGDVGGM